MKNSEHRRSWSNLVAAAQGGAVPDIDVRAACRAAILAQARLVDLLGEWYERPGLRWGLGAAAAAAIALAGGVLVAGGMPWEDPLSLLVL
jgi:hypothetical protein